MLLFTFLLISFYFFLMSNFDVRRYNGSYLSCSYAPCPMKFTTFIDESVQEKINQFPSHTGDLKSYLKLQEKDCQNKNIYFLYLSVLVAGQYHLKFPRNQFVQFPISSMLYMYKEPPEIILSADFGLFGDNFATSLIQPEIKRQR